MSPNMKVRQKTNSSGMDILSPKEMIKFEHASIQKFDPSIRATRLEVSSRMGRMNQVMHKMRNARLALQLGKNIEDDQTQPAGTE